MVFASSLICSSCERKYYVCMKPVSSLPIITENTGCDPSVERIIDLCPVAAVSLFEFSGCIDDRAVLQRSDLLVFLARAISYGCILACACIDDSFYTAGYVVKGLIIVLSSCRLMRL